MSSNSRPQILLFGDSLTQFGSSVSIAGPGWATFLAESYMRKADVINRGYSGYNSTWSLHMLDQLFSKTERVAFVTVLLGANDSSLLELNPKQHVPLEEYKKNLIQIVEFFQNRFKQEENKKTAVFLFSPPPVNEEDWLKFMRNRSPDENIERSDRFDEEVKKYANGVLEVASSTGAFLVDLYGEMKRSPDWKKYLEDGLHLSSLGNKFSYDQLIKSIKKNAPHLHYDTLTMEFPDWKEVDPNRLEETLQMKK